MKKSQTPCFLKFFISDLFTYKNTYYFEATERFFSSGKLSQCIFGHLDVVTCLAHSADSCTGTSALIVSGSRDATVLVWLWDEKKHRVVVPNVPTCKCILFWE